MRSYLRPFSPSPSPSQEKPPPKFPIPRLACSPYLLVVDELPNSVTREHQKLVLGLEDVLRNLRERDHADLSDRKKKEKKRRNKSTTTKKNAFPRPTHLALLRKVLLSPCFFFFLSAR